MKLSSNESLLLVMIDSYAEDTRDYVPVSKIANHFNTLREFAAALNSCADKKLIILSDMGKLTEVALRESGIRYVIERKKMLGIIPR